MVSNDADETADSSGALIVNLPKKENLGFEKGLEDQFVPIGKAIELEIKTIGSPTQVKWYKNGQEVLPKDNEVVIEKLGDNHFKLTIPSSSLSDSGNYSVKILNKDDSAESTAKVIVNPIPSFLRPLRDVEVIEGKYNFNTKLYFFIVVIKIKITTL